MAPDDDLGFRIFCITDEFRERVKRSVVPALVGSGGGGFFEVPFTPHVTVSLRVLSCEMKAFKLEAELFLRLVSK